MTPGNNLVSIIIPVYNAEKYLVQCIESAIDQTWPDKEIIIVDDGSADGSLDIARRYAGDGIKIFSQPNKGASAARNRGLAQATGDYIQFLDADDLLSSDKIERQITGLMGQPGKIAVCSTVHFPDGEDHTSFLPSAYEDRFLENIPGPVEFLIKIWGGYDNKGTMIQPNAWLIPAALVRKAGSWNEQLTLDDDGEFFCRIILNSDGIIKTDGVFNYYRKHARSGSLSGAKSRKGLDSLLSSVLSKKKELLSRCNSREARQAINRLLYDVFINSYPAYPEIYKIADKELMGNGAGYKPSLGGRKINLLAGIFGIKAALQIRHLLKSDRS